MVDIAESTGFITVFIVLGGNNFNPLIKDSNVHNRTVEEIISHFEDLLQFSEKSSGTKIKICSLIPRPKFSHLKIFFEKTSIGLSVLCKKYKCGTFIDCHSLFQDASGQTLLHYYKLDRIHLNRYASEKLALHIFNSF